MAEKFILNILGTASAKPSLKRFSSAQLLQAAGRLFLIDCAEGTQFRILQQNRTLAEKSRKENGVRHISTTNLDAIFISHAHGDHMFGLFPLLSTMGMNARTKPLEIYGPANLKPILNFYKSFWGDKDNYEIKFTPLESDSPELIYEVLGLNIYAFPLNHGISTYGYLFTETDAVPNKPRSYAYVSDTAPFDELSGWLEGVDLLYHEATYMANDFRKAGGRYHSTTLDAARCAKEAGAGRLIVGHYSAAIKEDSIHKEYLQEMRSVFPESYPVNDLDIIELPEEAK